MFLKLRKSFKSLSISNQLTIYFIVIFSAFSFLLYYTIPILLNYPPDTINTTFDKEVSVLYYIYQFFLAVIGITLFFICYLKVALKDVDKWWKNKSSNLTDIIKVRKKAMNFPYKTYIYMEILPALIVLSTLILTGSHPLILLFKMTAIIFSFSTFIASVFLVFSKNTLYPVLKESSKYVVVDEHHKQESLSRNLVFQLFPGVLVVALIMSLVGYYRLTIEKENLLNNYYKTSLSSEAYKITTNNISEINDILSAHYLDDLVYSFIEYPDGTIYTSNNTTLSHFFVKYMHDLTPSHNNTVYEAYTIDCQAVIQEINIRGESYTVGIYYEISSFSSFLLFLFISIVLFIFNLIMIFYVVISLVKDIKKVDEELKHIINNDSLTDKTKLPITSNDELGALSINLNMIQKLNREQLDQIKDNQDKLMEKERLASLGQLIGGIAHNLKTPIMSISGAAEGISDLIKEYEISIGDPQVTNEDHHDIAKDMSVWVEKIREYTEYMSDVITAVKGQAVVLSEEDNYTFTIEELSKRVDILMKHELKNALINLNIHMNVDSSIELKGNVNSLVQVINNMISNAIQAYNGETNKDIEFIINKDKNNIIFSIKDYAGGLPKEVEKKLFKEMITTKGKNGTGLGLFMSYSNIRAHFNGNITVKTEQGVGTQFDISLPIL